MGSCVAGCGGRVGVRATQWVAPTGPSLGVLGDVVAFVCQVLGVANYVVVVVALPDGRVRGAFHRVDRFCYYGFIGADNDAEGLGGGIALLIVGIRRSWGAFSMDPDDSVHVVRHDDPGIGFCPWEVRRELVPYGLGNSSEVVQVHCSIRHATENAILVAGADGDEVCARL